MKIHFRFFLSHDTSEKYQYFMKKVCILRKISAKPPGSAVLYQRHNTPSFDVTGKEAQKYCKKCYVTCVLLENLWNGFMKGESCDKYYIYAHFWVKRINKQFIKAVILTNNKRCWSCPQAWTSITNS